MPRQFFIVSSLKGWGRFSLLASLSILLILTIGTILFINLARAPPSSQIEIALTRESDADDVVISGTKQPSGTAQENTGVIINNPDQIIGGKNSVVNDIIHDLGPNNILAKILKPTETIKMLGQELSSLPTGDIVLDAPKEMRVGDTRQIDANVGINVPKDILEKKVSATTQQIKGQAQLSSVMIASLTGDSFDIKRITSEEQTIAEGFPTVWSWNITAKEEGNQELEAILYAVVPIGDAPTRQRVNSFTQKINVGVRQRSVKEWLKMVSDEVAEVKVIAVAIAGIVTAVLGWFGISRVRQRTDLTAKRVRTNPDDY
jgi:hypothetical protein